VLRYNTARVACLTIMVFNLFGTAITAVCPLESIKECCEGVVNEQIIIQYL